MYNDQSVLEHHHCASTFRVLKEQKCNIFDGMEVVDQRELRKIIIAGILCTDMVCTHDNTLHVLLHMTAYYIIVH